MSAGVEAWVKTGEPKETKFLFSRKQNQCSGTHSFTNRPNCFPTKNRRESRSRAFAKIRDEPRPANSADYQ